MAQKPAGSSITSETSIACDQAAESVDEPEPHLPEVHGGSPDFHDAEAAAAIEAAAAMRARLAAMMSDMDDS